MIHKISVVSCFLIFISLTATSQGNDLYKEMYYGDVRSVLYTEIFEGDNKRDPKDTVEYGYEYNTDGLTVLFFSPYPFGTGNVEMHYTFNDSGNCIMEHWIYANDTIHMLHFFYDESNKLIELLKFSKDPERHGKVTYHYNAIGLEDFVLWAEDDMDTVRKTTLYDGQGRCIKTIREQSGNIETTTYEYDSNGNIIAEQFVDHKYGRNSNTYTKKYNQDNKLIESIGYDGNGIVTSMYVYEYNEHGDAISWYSYDPSGKVIYFEKTSYEYDSLGNWIVARNYKGKKLFYTEYRTFIYY